MFNEQQVQSYNSITAPADLRQKVLTACENTAPAKKLPARRTLYRVAPLAACLLLLVSVLALNRSEPLMLYAGDVQLEESNITLPPVAEPVAVAEPAAEPVAVAEPAAYGLRTCSLEPEQYTVTLTGSQSMEILTADGTATQDEAGNIRWTVLVPAEDMVYELFLSTGDDTYYVPLQYNVQDGSFSIRYEAQ